MTKQQADSLKQKLAGRRVLVVEDEFFIADDIAKVLSQYGAEVVGPVGTIDQAIGLASKEALSYAVLDLNLHGRSAFEVAQILDARHVPYICLSGYDRKHAPRGLNEIAYFEKPIDIKSIADRLTTMGGSK